MSEIQVVIVGGVFIALIVMMIMNDLRFAPRHLLPALLIGIGLGWTALPGNKYAADPLVNMGLVLIVVGVGILPFLNFIRKSD